MIAEISTEAALIVFFCGFLAGVAFMLATTILLKDE